GIRITRPAPARLAGDSNRFSFSRRLRKPTRLGGTNRSEQLQATAFCVPNNGPVSSDAEGSNTKSPKLILHSHAHLSSRNCPTLAQPAEVMDRRSASTRNRAPRTAKTVRRFQILDHLLAGSLSESHLNLSHSMPLLRPAFRRGA